MTLQLVQIGLGGWGRNWVEEVTRDTPGVEPVAWVDLDSATRKRAVVDLGLPRERVFAVPRAGAEAGRRRRGTGGRAACGACADHPRRARRRPARPGREAVHRDLEEARRSTAGARAAARAHGQPELPLVPRARLARRLLHDGALGHLVACYLDFHFYFGTGYRYFFLEEPLLSDMAIHHFDALRFVLDDEPVEVSCHSWAEPGTPFAGPPAAVATLRFANGTWSATAAAG